MAIVRALGIRAVVVVLTKVLARDEAWAAGDKALVRLASVFALVAGQRFLTRQAFPVVLYHARSAAGRC
ncbi:MAG: hypothetical protein OEV79_11670 [candidate division WOR-3 bacterium]|nr:hypothetical protein [candidate division WOR-3 bacterium]